VTAVVDDASVAVEEDAVVSVLDSVSGGVGVEAEIKMSVKPSTNFSPNLYLIGSIFVRATLRTHAAPLCLLW
jgi:hypothetical protein